MNFLSRFLGWGQQPSAEAARDRLQVLLAHERAHANQPEYLPRMHQEIIDVIRRYVDVEDQKIEVQVEHTGNVSMLEVNIELPPASVRATASQNTPQNTSARGHKKRQTRARPVAARLAESAEPGTA